MKSLMLLVEMSKNHRIIVRSTAKSNLKQHQSKYVLLKSENDLTQEQQLKLEAIQQVSPLLARMHSLKEEFREIFESSQNGQMGLSVF